MRANLAVLLLLPFAASAQPVAAALHKLFAEYHEDTLRDFPEMGTVVGRDDLNDRWRDHSPDARRRWRERLKTYLTRLAAFQPAALTPQDRVSRRVLQHSLEAQLSSEPIFNSLLAVGQEFGWHRSVLMTLDSMPARNVRDYENILARLEKLPAVVDQRIARIERGLERNWVQPRLVLDLVIRQFDNQMDTPMDTTPVLNAFRRFPPGMPKAEQERLRARGMEAYEKRFLPAWRKMRDYLAGTYARRARETVGFGALPDGKEIYGVMTRFVTTVEMKPEEIHRLGVSEVERIEGEMLAIARETGFRGSLEEFETKLRTSPDQLFRTKEEMLAYCRNAAKIVEPELPRLFKTSPRFLYGIRAIPPDRESNAASNAQPPAPDGSRPGWFNLSTYRPETQVKFDKEALVLHEAVPGHVFQTAVQMQSTGLPEFRKLYRNTAFSEGWALYAESLGSELGLYGDPHSRFGQLGSERFRAVRLVVDTGLHVFGWTREQATAYFKQHAPIEPIAEIDRYISAPTQALAYKIGQLKIIELRRRAERELGPKFDIREFHDVVLRNGALPLVAFEEEVVAYIEQARRSAGQNLSGAGALDARGERARVNWKLATGSANHLLGVAASSVPAPLLEWFERVVSA